MFLHLTLQYTIGDYSNYQYTTKNININDLRLISKSNIFLVLRTNF